ncbi:MAG: HTH domain-containing protein [Candidatus Aenigmatarchaeota archaeon]
MEQNLIKNILDVLSKHPEGLTISSLADKTGVHRHTATKYVKDLILSGKVEERKVGMAKLCFLSKYKPVHAVTSEKAETGQVQIFLLTLILMAIPVLIIAQNIDNSTNAVTGNFPEVFDTLTVTSSSDIMSTTTSFEDQELSTVLDDQISATTSTMVDELSTLSTTQISDSNYSENQNSESYNVSNDLPDMPSGNDKVKIEFDYNQKVTRGSTFSVKVVLTSNLDGLRKISYEWVTPNDMNILNEKSGSCNLEFGQSCDSELLIDTESSELGLKKIKIVVTYE